MVVVETSIGGSRKKQFSKHYRNTLRGNSKRQSKKITEIMNTTNLFPIKIITKQWYLTIRVVLSRLSVGDCLTI